MSQATVSFPTNMANYNARIFVIPLPSVPTTYYVTIYDPAYLGDTGTSTDLLSYIQTSTALIGQPGYVYMGSILALPAGCGIQSGPGGQPVIFNAIISAPVKTLNLAPLGAGNFTVAHGLGAAPSFVMIQMTSAGAIWLQSPTSFDSTNLYLTASDAGLTGVAIMWLASADAEVALTPGAAGNFTVPHGLGASPVFAMVEMTSGGAIWFQSPPWDATNLYLVASDAGLTGKAEVLMNHSVVHPVRFSRVPLVASAPGNFAVAHGIGSTPKAVVVTMSSGGTIWFQSPTSYDSTNLYLVASDTGLTGEAEVWG
jgi:hypothetical protein